MLYTDETLHRALRTAQGMGLVSPFILKLWKPWWQEADLIQGSITDIKLSKGFNNKQTRKEILETYTYAHETVTSVYDLLAHEMGHAFQSYWSHNKRVAPLSRYLSYFPHFNRFKEPWEGLSDYRDKHPDAVLDKKAYISWYAYTCQGEDFAECFAEVMKRKGDISSFPKRSIIYRKLRAILKAGERILDADPVLRRCNHERSLYLFGGHQKFTCPSTNIEYGVPLSYKGKLICVCGAQVVLEGKYIKHL